MKCMNCGQEYPVGKFCPSCGTPAPEASTQTSLASSFEEITPNDTYTYSEEPKAEDVAATYHPPVSPVMPAKRKRSGGIIAAIVAVLLVAGIVFAIFAFGGNGPADAIGKGLKKNLDSEIFNFEVSVSQGKDSITMTGTVEFNPEEGILNFYIEGHNKAIDAKITTCLYDGCGFSVEEEDGEKWYSYSELDEDALDEFFDYYLEYGDSDLNKKKDVLLILEEIDDLTDGELSEIVDLEVLAECVTEYVGAHNDKNWLEENAGFSQEKKDGTTYYTYEPNLYELAEISLPFFEEAFEDNDVYDEGMDAIKDSRSELKAVNLEVTFGVKSGYLTSIVMDVEGIEIEVIFSEFGKAELDYDELDDLAAECEKGYEEQWRSYYD